MPKSKKQKRAHHRDRHDKYELTQAEIWDDSALIRSWDEAVQEYELYHSIHARGEDVEEVLRRAELEENGMLVDPGMGAEEELDPLEDGEVEDGEVDEAEIDGEDLAATAKPASGLTNGSAIAKAGPSNPPRRMIGPQIPGGGHADQVPAVGPDQTLENLKMAYWWAGYYSGLYEGQRQAHAQKTPDNGKETRR